MYCRYCGEEIRDEAVFCPMCGKNISTGEMNSEVNLGKAPIKKELSERKKITIVCAVIVSILFFVIISSVKSTSIVGIWMDGTDQVTFTESGEYQRDSNYGTYTIASDKTLEIEYGYYSYNSGTRTFIWGPEAMENSDYWYISGGKLYLFGNEYTKNR